MSLRVVFTGQSGIKKSKVIENVVRNTRLRCGYGDKSDEAAEKFLKLYPVEKYIAYGPTAFAEYLQQPERVQLRQWEDGFEDLLEAVDNDNADNVFLSMHSVFSKFFRFYSPVNWQQLERFEPHLFITLIDDVYDIWWRLKRRQEAFQPSGGFRLRELMGWRTAEIMMADTLARNLIPGKRLPHYVVAVKHPIDMLVRLLLEPQAMRIYAPYPITKTREDPDRREVIDKHRRELHERFVTFDPLTIDEKVLQFLLEEWEKSNPQPETITFDRKPKPKGRWPVPSEACNLPLLTDGIEYPDIIEGIDPIQVQEIIDVGELDFHIVWRDYRLIDQGHCLPAFRPHYEGEMSGGVAAEIDYAYQSGTQVYQFFPDDDGRSAPFQHKGVITDDYKEFLRMLEQHEQQIQEYSIRPSHRGKIECVPEEKIT